MSERRILLAMFEGQETIGVERATRITRLARTQGAELRVAYFHPIPPGRIGRDGRIIVETDREMTRIERELVTAVGDIARAEGTDAVHCVVRFGRPARELDVELDVYRPETVMFLSPARVVDRWRLWWARQRLARRADVRVVLLDAREGRADRARRLAAMGQRA